MPESRYEHSDTILDRLFSSLTVLVRTSVKYLPSPNVHLDMGRMLALRTIADSEECRTGDIGHILAIKGPAVTSLLDSLEREGLVARAPSPIDKRVVHLRITDRGSEELERAEAYRRQVMREKLAGISDDDIESLIRIQGELVKSFAASAE